MGLHVEETSAGKRLGDLQAKYQHLKDTYDLSVIERTSLGLENEELTKKNEDLQMMIIDQIDILKVSLTDLHSHEQIAIGSKLQEKQRVLADTERKAKDLEAHRMKLASDLSAVRSKNFDLEKQNCTLDIEFLTLSEDLEFRVVEHDTWVSHLNLDPGIMSSWKITMDKSFEQLDFPDLDLMPQMSAREQQFMDLYDRCDVNKTGILSIFELIDVLSQLLDTPATNTDAIEILGEGDTDGDYRLDRKEFITIMMKRFPTQEIPAKSPFCIPVTHSPYTIS